jgi:hypothetical protein
VHDPSVDQYSLAKLTRWLLGQIDTRALTSDDGQLRNALEQASSVHPGQRFRRIGELVSELEGALQRATQRPSSRPSNVVVRLADGTLRVSVSGAWTPESVETCSRDIDKAVAQQGARAIGYVLEAESGCHSAAIDTLAELHRRHRGRIRRVGFVACTPQARGTSVLIGRRVEGLDWKTFASVDGMDAWLREANR